MSLLFYEDFCSRSRHAEKITGYFLFEAAIYPALGRAIPFFAVTDANAALVEIIPNRATSVSRCLWHLAGVQQNRRVNALVGKLSSICMARPFHHEADTRDRNGTDCELFYTIS